MYISIEQLKKTTLYAVALTTMCVVGACTEQSTTKRQKPRVVVSTDIGGTDPDDNQSMAHLMMYTDKIDLEGLVSSPSYGSGSKEEMLRMIDLFEKDYDKLCTHVDGLLSPDSLRKLCKQGRRGLLPHKGYAEPTEGSKWIVDCARRQDRRPLWILVWGTLDDVAQALHDAPDIADKIKIHYIGGPNKKWGVNSHAYVAENFPNVWMIENNATYRGFISDKKKDDKYNAGYYDYAIKGHGHMADDFINYYGGLVKMGDTPTLLYMMNGDPDDPTCESWGGSFVKTKHTSRDVLHHPMSANDTVHIYTVMEIHFAGPKLDIDPDSVCFTTVIDKQTWAGYYLGEGDYCLRYSPHKQMTHTYETTSAIGELNGLRGEFVVDKVWPGTQKPTDYVMGENWYTDSSDPALWTEDRERLHGVQTTLKWRNEVLEDWAMRWKWITE